MKMALLGNLKQKEDVKDSDSDSLGGVYTVDSGAYLVTVDLAYVDKSAGGAMSLNMHLKTEAGDIIKQTLWIMSGDAKGNKTYYTNKKGENHSLPGFSQANTICKFTAGKRIDELETETKVINLYNFEAKKEIPTKVETIPDVMDKQFVAGLIKQIVDKNVKDGSGVYVPSGETREENEIDKIFNEDGLTSVELGAGLTEPAFINKWKEKWDGQVKNKAKGKSASNGVATGMPTASAPASKPTKSLFS